RSGGRHQMKMFHSRRLGEEKESLEQTGVGGVDLNRTNLALIGAMAPSVNVLAMPFLFRSIEHLQKVLDGLIGNEILDSFEPYGFVGPALNESGARSKGEGENLGSGPAGRSSGTAGELRRARPFSHRPVAARG